jgi:hypothetical protein
MRVIVSVARSAHQQKNHRMKITIRQYSIDRIRANARDESDGDAEALVQVEYCVLLWLLDAAEELEANRIKEMERNTQL